MSKVCSYCGEGFDRIGTHWRYNPEHQPELSKYQKSVITGILMGDGWIHRDGRRPAFKVSTQEKEYVEFVFELLKPLSCSINEYSDGLYTMTTHSLDCLSQFESWYDDKKTFPKDLKLNKEILKHWYACDGSLVRQRYINIGASNESERSDFLISLFNEQNLPEPRINIWGDNEMQLVWKVEQSKKLLSYMGRPVSGYEYKWERVKYDSD